MANFNVMKVSILIILLILSANASGFEAAQMERKTLRKRINGSSVLRELGFHLSKMKRNINVKRRAMTDTETDTTGDRITPGGPGHMHHTSPPTMH